ncbi:hypothetical protein EUGRSUZ_H01512 [Eucalyptus grandis]|uniref:Uncharacterized protein n=2 Tax=Eucalyptus grandis TaxID=71139 RepID=A0ACC3JRC7_EUCGR|nr:hypothetical protein EUGRSUZ_H01512 [Eucalyptus grandis]
MPIHIIFLAAAIITLAPPPTLSLSASPPPSPPPSLPLLAPIQKDHTTLRYTLSVYLKTPPQRLDLLLHLGGRFSWVDCYSGNYSSATYRHIPCNFSVAEARSLPRCFALCLSGSRSAAGVTFVGTAGPYNFLPGIDLSKGLTYTPILLNPQGDTVITYAREPAAEYYVGVTAVRVNGKVVPLNATLLAIDEESGRGGTLISTVLPYTALQTSIFRAVTQAFAREASAAFNLTTIQPVKPFSLCYSARDVGVTRAGPAVPAIDLVMQSEEVFWRVFGANSMVRIQRKGTDAWCLGLVDGGAEARAAIVIGGHQVEDNLLQFDLGSMRLGFSSSVLVRGTTCADFNFTTDNHT